MHFKYIPVMLYAIQCKLFYVLTVFAGINSRPQICFPEGRPEALPSGIAHEFPVEARLICVFLAKID